MNIKNLSNMVKAMVLGAVAMYICDPVVGRRRRALARDKMVRLRKATQEAARITMRDLKNRTWGTVAEGRAAFFGDRVDDAVLAERVRSKLGFVVRNPSSIDVQASNGTVTLTGPVFTDEIQQLVDGIRSVRGVRDVENFLSVHQTDDNIPGLQGDVPKPEGQLLDVFQRRWSPSTRFLLGTAGIVLLFGLNPFRRTAVGLLMSTGLGLLACSVAEEEWRERNRSDSRNNEMDATVAWSS
jgi:BON domain